MTALLAELMGNCVPSRGGADPEEGFTYTALRHVRQSFSWDCGLACVMMVLQHKGMSAPLEEMMTIAGTKSVWTVDLAYILSRYSVDFTFYAVTDGVRPEYGDEAFYKVDIDADMVRVNKLFETAASLNISIDKRSVGVDEILECVARGGMTLMVPGTLPVNNFREFVERLRGERPGRRCRPAQRVVGRPRVAAPADGLAAFHGEERRRHLERLTPARHANASKPRRIPSP